MKEKYEAGRGDLLLKLRGKGWGGESFKLGSLYVPCFTFSFLIRSISKYSCVQFIVCVFKVYLVYHLSLIVTQQVLCHYCEFLRLREAKTQ